MSARRGRGRRTAGIVVVLVLAVAAAACSGGGGDDPGTTSRAAGGADADPADGGRVRLGLSGTVVADPVLVSLASPGDLMVLDLLHDGLTRLDDAGDARSALARSWTADAERTTWEFELDPAATFSDGRPVTAADVVASLERVAAGGDSSLPALRLELVQGFRAFVDGDAQALSGLLAVDDATVRIVLDSPLSVLPELLASPVYGIVDTASLATGAATLAVGQPLSGMWSVGEAGEDRVVLERRGQEAHLDEVELRSFDDSLAAYEAFDEGKVDWAPVPAERYGDAAEEHGDDHFAPFHAELFFGMNPASLKLGDERFRQAIAAAIDREAIVAAVYEDLAEPLSTVVPAGVTGHDPERCPSCAHDPERARRLVAETFPDGAVPTVSIDFDQSPAQQAMAEMVASDLAAVGITTSLRPLPIEEYKGFVISGQQELFSFGWIGVYASPDAYLAPLFRSGAADNLTGYASTDVDALLDLARATGDAAAARAAWAEAEAAILRTAVVVPIAQFRVQVVVDDRVQDLVHAVDGSVDWSQVWVADSG